jgi:Protein of unknown function (DUF664)
MRTSMDLAWLYRRDLARLVRQLDAFPDGLLWQVTPGVTNSAGNLMLHLDGNLRDFVGRVLGGVAYERDRPREFAATNVPRSEIATALTGLVTLVPNVIERVEPVAWDATYPLNVLGEPMSTRQFVVHLYGHLNYHLGQIDYLRRVLTGDGALTPPPQR